MRPPITIADRLQEAGSLLLLAGLVLGVGLALLGAIGRSSPVRRRHGRFVLGWMLAGWLSGGAIGVCMIDNVVYYRGEADAGLAGFGLLLGWVIGMIHGGVALAGWPEKPPNHSVQRTHQSAGR